jgi:SAM-dependent methyltransferase
MSFMESPIIESKYSALSWLSPLGSPVAERVLAWEQSQADALLADVFGYHALQMGWPALQSLRSNRMPHRWTVSAEFESPRAPDVLASGTTPDVDVRFDSRAWPWSADSLDLVVLPHALERSADPHACLREVTRVLIPEGQVLITGLNPMSFWGWQYERAQRKTSNGFGSEVGLIGYRRLRDWLRLLGFEVQVSRFAGWTPALASERWMRRFDALDTLGQRWWPIFGGVYLILATKRVPAGRLLDGRRWRAVRSPAAATVPLARSDSHTGRQTASKDTF